MLVVTKMPIATVRIVNNNTISLDESRKNVTLLQEQVNLLQLNILDGDSIVALRELEAQKYYNELLKTDESLEKCRIARTRFWNRKSIWFIIGGLTTAAVISVN